MWFIYVLSWIALFIQIAIITLSIAAGLYYLAELVEENTVFTSKIIFYLIIFTSVIHGGILLFEDFPFYISVLGLVANFFHFCVLQNFPYFYMTSPSFIGSVVLIVINHYLTFSHFSQVWYPFSEVMAYFTVCLWLVPFAFFVSLSANEYVLPTTTASTDHLVSSYFKSKEKRYGLLSFFKYAQESILPQRVKKQF
ncbi:hypothetical protein LOTGIDRAFT_119829 [Lottia gigantea]|uniref:Protein TEX261 n=1 Tax=Lottia gigantea TaxID=225164 RepID=V4AD90_LOTGI|nr:hypothetical protein LOTGIDRAFT_119829 [Lottia gigantea]ESO93075.1 hypothetical protein LOTGIDRAFT_119829 [Lottia gigantea]